MTMKANPLNPVVMRNLAAALFALIAVTTHAEVEAKITKTFKAASGDQLIVNVDRGDIEIKTAEGDAVSIEVERRAGGSDAKARQTLIDHFVTLTQTGSKVEVRAEYKGPKPGLLGSSP